jgi:hypothetical protein
VDNGAESDMLMAASSGLSWRGASCYLPAMLDPAEINRVVSKAASAILARLVGIQRVVSEPALDSQGHEALHITIVLKKGSADKISGDKALDTLVSIEKALRNEMEERFPIIDFMTEEEEELESSGDIES